MLKMGLLLSMLVVSVWAHKLNLFTAVEQNRLYVQAYFANGKGCNACQVILKDKNRKLSIHTQTNNKGEVDFFVQEGHYVLYLDAGSGHEKHEDIMVDAMTNVTQEGNNNLQQQNQQLQNKIKVLQSQLEWMNILKTLLAIIAIIAIFGFLKRIKQ